VRKIGIGDYQLPTGKGNVANSGRILWERELERLKDISTGNVMAIALRAVDRAERYDCKHPFWNALANCYLQAGRRIEELNILFPGIKRVIHHSEVIRGDVLVSDFKTGMNFGFVNGGIEPVGVRVLDIDGELLRGEVMRSVNTGYREVGHFKNEVWFFISHKFAVYSSVKAASK